MYLVLTVIKMALFNCVSSFPVIEMALFRCVSSFYFECVYILVPTSPECKSRSAGNCKPKSFATTVSGSLVRCVSLLYGWCYCFV